MINKICTTGFLVFAALTVNAQISDLEKAIEDVRNSSIEIDEVIFSETFQKNGSVHRVKLFSSNSKDTAFISYDQRGLVSNVQFIKERATWQTHYSYDSSDSLIATFGVISERSGSNIDSSEFLVGFNRDYNGQVRKIDITVDSVILETKLFEYDYDSLQKMINRSVYERLDTSISLQFIDSFSYQSFDSLTIDSINSQSKHTDKDWYQLNDMRLEVKTRLFPDFSERSSDTTYFLSFDSIEMITNVSSNTHQILTYNKKGELISYSGEYFGTDFWTELTYYPNGLLKTVRFRDGPDADIEYAYDDLGNPTEMRWTEIYGKSYTVYYEYSYYE